MSERHNRGTGLQHGDSPHANLDGTHARSGCSGYLNEGLPPGLTAEYREDGDRAWYQVTVYDPVAYREYLGIDDSASRAAAAQNERVGLCEEHQLAGNWACYRRATYL